MILLTSVPLPEIRLSKGEKYDFDYVDFAWHDDSTDTIILGRALKDSDVKEIVHVVNHEMLHLILTHLEGSEASKGIHCLSADELLNM